MAKVYRKYTFTFVKDPSVQIQETIYFLSDEMMDANFFIADLIYGVNA